MLTFTTLEAAINWIAAHLVELDNVELTEVNYIWMVTYC